MSHTEALSCIISSTPRTPLLFHTVTRLKHFVSSLIVKGGTEMCRSDKTHDVWCTVRWSRAAGHFVLIKSGFIEFAQSLGFLSLTMPCCHLFTTSQVCADDRGQISRWAHSPTVHRIPGNELSGATAASCDLNTTTCKEGNKHCTESTLVGAEVLCCCTAVLQKNIIWV